MNRSRLAALSAGAMLLVATVLAPVASADTGGTNTIKVIPATTTISPVGTGSSFTVNVVANGSVAISGAGAGLTFDNSKLQLTNLVKDPTEVANGVAYAGFPSAANLATFISNANTAGSIPVIAWTYQDGSSNETANADHGIYAATFSVSAVGDSTLTPFLGATGAILDGTAGNYGNPLTPTLVNGNVVNHVGPAFSISASPGSTSAPKGGSSSPTITVHTATTAGTPGSVNLSASGLPAGASANFTPASVDPNVAANQDSSLTFTTTAATPTGNFTVTITGTDSSDGTDVHSTTVSLTIFAPNDYTLTATPPSVAVSAGGAGGTTSISVTQVQPVVGTVALSITSAPISGVTTAFTAGSATVGTPDTLTITASAAATPGSYTITVQGDNGAGGNIHTVPVSLTINGAAGANQQDVGVTGSMDGGFIGLSCPTSITIGLFRGNTNQANVPCVVYTNTVWNLAVNDANTPTDAYQGHMVTGRPVDGTTKYALADSMHVLASSYLSGGDTFYANNVDLANGTGVNCTTAPLNSPPAPLPGGCPAANVLPVTGGTILGGTNTANAPLVLSQFVAAGSQAGSYSIQLLFSAMSVF